MRRIRQRTIIVLVLLGLAAIAVTGLVVWAVWSVRPYSPVPPPPTASPAQAAAVDLSQLGLAAVETKEIDDGVRAIWRDTIGNAVWVEVRQFAGPDSAHGAYEAWHGQFRTQIMATNMNMLGSSVSKFQSSGHHLYACQVDNWFFDVIVPDRVTDPALLLNRIRDALFVAYENMSGGSGGSQ